MLAHIIKRIMAAELKHVPIPRKGVDYRGKVVLAPMVRSGELPSRLLALQYGADLVWGPETIDKAMVGTYRKVNHDSKTIDWVRPQNNGQKVALPDAKENAIFRMHPVKETGKLIFQIGTNDPDRAVEASRLVAGDVAGIDVNAGCPKPFSTHSGMGAALLRTPDKLCAILEALVKHIVPEFEIGISVKIRLLETPEETEVLVRRLCGTGITGLTIHCRTTPMRPRERALRDQLKMIVNVCHEYGVACLVNGDVESKDHGLKLASEYGADGGMIATCAEKNPSCFRTEAEGGLLPWRVAVEEYIKLAMSVDNKWGNTKFLVTQMVPGKAKEEYQACTRAKSYVDVCKALKFEDLMVLAQEADVRIGRDDQAQPAKEQKKKANPSALAAGGQSGKGRENMKKKLSERGVTSRSEADGETISNIEKEQPSVTIAG